jgi:protein-S-isoprenylcysteine O-methyltransferase Ste14
VVGFALTLRRVPVVSTVASLLGWAYWRRISAEEDLLRHELPGYSDYASRTRKLVTIVPPMVTVSMRP